MKTIRVKINIVLFAIFICGGWFGWLSLDYYFQSENLQNQIAKSFSLRNEIHKINPKNVTELTKNRLRKIKRGLKAEHRKESISNIIQAYNSNNVRLFKLRLEDFDRSEKKFFKKAQRKIAKLRAQLQFNLILAVGIPFLLYCILFYYFNFRILNPLQQLSARMMEFLIDQYTFRFRSNTKNNEIGNLERTFNSLAQKVLNNMDELKALDNAKSEFVSIASHELRTPLTSIKGSLGLLSNQIVGSLDKEALDMVKVAEQETDRLVRLINDLLDLAKIESRSFELKKEWTSISELANKTIQGLHGFAQAAQVQLEYLPIEDDVEVNMDADRIQQVLTNLISNAIKYSPQYGTVILKCEVNGNSKVEVSISDEGPGISDENQAYIFEKFRQATDSSTPLVKGTGLGLAISKALIEEHGGTIGVESKLGEGATFYCTLADWRHAESEPQEEQREAA